MLSVATARHDHLSIRIQDVLLSNKDQFAVLMTMDLPLFLPRFLLNVTAVIVMPLKPGTEQDMASFATIPAMLFMEVDQGVTE
jgi:hypothetical protein